jgi:hypothetical protein
MSGLPDAAKYEALIDQLSVIERRAAAREIDALTASYYALSSVIQFLLDDPRVKESGATRSLGRLAFAVMDRTQGARPLLFFGPRKNVKGAPNYTSAVVLRALVNVAFGPLLEARMPKQEAGKWLAAELAHGGIKQPNGEEITAKQIIRWWAELGAESMKGSDEAFTWFVGGASRTMLESSGQIQMPPDTPLDQAQAKLAARQFIGLLRIAGF